MATRQKQAPVVTTIDDAAVETLYTAGHNYVDTVAANDLAALNMAIDADIAAHAVFAPAYAIAEANYLRDNAGSEYSAGRFTSWLNGRVVILHDNETDSIGVSDTAMKNIITFAGDREFHDNMVELYVPAAAHDKQTLSMPRYRKFLRDHAAGYYNEDGTRTATGRAALLATRPAPTNVRISSLNMDANLEGAPNMVALAWLDAVKEDVANMRLAVLARPTFSDEDKKLANKMVRNARDSKGAQVITLI